MADIPLAWSGGLSIEDFIAVSIKGRKNGDFIMHRENGTLANVNMDTQRGIGKMKATITQRLTMKGVPVDIDCDCRFIFFCKIEDGEWKTQWVKLFYEKDKVVPVNGKDVPQRVSSPRRPLHHTLRATSTLLLPRIASAIPS